MRASRDTHRCAERADRVGASELGNETPDRGERSDFTRKGLPLLFLRFPRSTFQPNHGLPCTLGFFLFFGTRCTQEGAVPTVGTVRRVRASVGRLSRRLGGWRRQVNVCGQRLMRRWTHSSIALRLRARCRLWSTHGIVSAHSTRRQPSTMTIGILHGTVLAIVRTLI